MKYATISSGVECHTLSSVGLGDEAVFFSEIAPGPCKLLKTKYPNVPILGDMTRVDYDETKGVIHNAKYDGYEMMSDKVLGFKPIDAEYQEISIKKGEITLVSGGTPCTDCSQAGKRQGAKEGSGTRSALAYQLPRVGSAVGADFLLFENVFGIFSSNNGEDFVWLIHRMTDYGYHSIAWRTVDAQFIRTDSFPRAVPQRRRRVFLVGYRGDDWRVPCEALFEPMKVLGNEPPKRTVGVGYLKPMPTSSDNGPQKTELEEFRDFIAGANKTILDVLVKKGVCESPEERMRELEQQENSKGQNAMDDLFGGGLFDQTEEEKHQGRGLKAADLELHMPESADIRSLPQYKVYEWAKTVCKEITYFGDMFKGEAEVENINPKLLANIGNAGFLCKGLVCTMKMPEWNAGVTEEELATMPTELAELYDGDVCGLSDVLEDNPDPKYKLSWRACYGILRRAVNRGKKMPIELGYALVERIIEQAMFVKWTAMNGKATVKKEGDLSERQIAKVCYDDYVEAEWHWADVNEEEPKKNGDDEESGNGDDIGSDADDIDEIFQDGDGEGADGESEE